MDYPHSIALEILMTGAVVLSITMTVGWVVSRVVNGIAGVFAGIVVGGSLTVGAVINVMQHLRP
ncbi:hypothetical protein QM312_30845 [Burkholderia cenocepacia]|uniref:hypothetical protein n=1 Tax=Burkholderia cenocepacia TaxID=95486 RepID=UPI0012B810EF|nr:hypothetical protein [Burkholderia cenocepacia]MDI9700344.1 hypothetical protein [Burkholderia cenocepacia]